MRKVLASATFLAALTTASTAFGGAGANMQACVYLAVAPAAELTFDFTSGSKADHCMNDEGHNASLTTKSAGVACVSVGYVEEKGSSSGGDLCATDKSIWTLGYASSDGAYSGSTQAHMSHPLFSHNHIELYNSSPDTYVCTQKNLCNATKQQWDSGTQGPLYIIFEPGAHN